MHTVVFVHGTGVREPAYTSSFTQVQQQITTRLGAANIRIEPCYWGGPLGSTLFLKGVSIPGIDTTRAVDPGAGDTDDYAIALWAMLYDDPFSELHFLGLGATGSAAPGQEPLGAELDERARQLTADGGGLRVEARAEFVALLETARIAEYFDAACADVLKHPTYKRAMELAAEPLTEYRLAVARAIVADSALLYCEHYEVDGAPFDGPTRDRIVELLVAGLGGREAGVRDWVKEKAGGLISRLGTRWVGRRRGRLSVAAAPFGADVIVHQTRPKRISEFIRKTVVDASEAARVRGEDTGITVIAHSLGGIATVDMLIAEPLPLVQLLVTVGSQSPLLYEMDALTSLPIRRDEKDVVLAAPHSLPAGFPRWLNIYDPRDFLSYRAEPVFGTTGIHDERVDNGQPFPDSHSAYWTNDAVWKAIVGHIAGTPV